MDVLEPTWRSECGRVQLYLGDCRDVLPILAVGSVDCVIADPPYDIPVGAAFVRSNCKRITDGNEPMNVGCGWEWVSLLGCLRPAGNAAVFHKAGDQLPPPLIAWHRFYLVKSAPPPTTRPCFVSAVEECSIGAMPGGKRRWFGSGYVPNYWLWLTPRRLNATGGHPAEKPLDAITTLVTSLSDDGETVLDPFVGSGTTGVACLRTGRKFIGIELERPYFDMAQRRIKDELTRYSLFTNAEKKTSRQRPMLPVVEKSLNPTQ